MKNTYLIIFLFLSTFSLKSEFAKQFQKLFNPEKVRLEEEARKQQAEAESIAFKCPHTLDCLFHIIDASNNKNSSVYSTNLGYHEMTDIRLDTACYGITDDIDTLRKLMEKSSSLKNKETIRTFLKNLHFQLKQLAEKNNSPICPQALESLSKIFDNK